MRTDARKDRNAGQLVDELRRIGCSVEILSGRGLPDLLVGFRRLNFLLEVKAPGGELTPAQSEFFKLWRGQAAIVTALEDARMVLKC